jgi:hypothetical protein
MTRRRTNVLSTPMRHVAEIRVRRRETLLDDTAPALAVTPYVADQ